MNPFSRTALIAVIGVAAVSLAVAVVLAVVGDDLTARVSAGADSYSTSAIGHRALVRMLEKLGVPVVVSRSDSGPKARNGVLIVAEPTATDDAARQRLDKLVTSAPRTLVVLPKWYGSTERGQPWIDSAHLLPESEVAAVADALGLPNRARIHRGPGPVRWIAEPGVPGPVIREPQLVALDGLEAIVFAERAERWFDTSGDVQLLGHATDDDAELFVLTDPDVLNNHGLRNADNARFALNLIDDLRQGGPVVIDETVHGYAQQPSLVRALLSFPLVLATLQLLVCALLAIWAAMVRFGPRRAAPPPIAPGKDFLIRNTAALLHYGGHHGHALKRYLQLTVAVVRHALHAPSLAPDAMAAWLERVRQVRGARSSVVELERAVDSADTPARVVEVADEVFRWRTEMTHGADSRS